MTPEKREEIAERLSAAELALEEAKEALNDAVGAVREALEALASEEYGAD